MKTDQLLAALHADLRKTPAHRVGRGLYVPLAKSRSLTPLLEDSLETEEEREEYAGSFAAWPGNVAQYLEEAGWLSSLLTFNWLGFGPTSSSAGLGLVGFSDVAWLVWWDEMTSYSAVAALVHPDDPAVVCAAVRDYVAGNPPFVEPIPFDLLPDTTFNYTPELLPEADLRAAYIGHLDGASSGLTAWRSFVDHYIDINVEPDHLQRCLSLLRGVTLPDDAEGAAELEFEDDSSDEPSVVFREATFDGWWKRTYQEESRRVDGEVTP